ncbi:hypothetical protein ACJJTC_016749 [Scirpophaga incertulas]
MVRQHYWRTYYLDQVAKYKDVIPQFFADCRVTLPKKFRSEESSKQLMKLACSIKVKRLAKYQQEYEKFVKESAEKEKIDDELDRLKTLNAQLLQEKEMYKAQLSVAQKSIAQAENSAAHYKAVSTDYREICARLDKQLHQIQDCVKNCLNCTKKLSEKDNDKECEQMGVEKEVGTNDTEMVLRQRVRDLELELAQVKLAHVQAQCSNQELSHQLNAALNEMQVNQKQSVTPWLVRTLGSIMEAAQNRPTFQTYIPNAREDQGAQLQRQGSLTHSQVHQHPANLGRRVSDPYSPDVVRRKKEHNKKRHSMLAESNVTKEAKEINRRSHSDIANVKNFSVG